MADIFEFLNLQGIAYERHDHPAVFTCEEAERLVPPLPAAHTKNLFLRDKKGERHCLVVVGYDKQVDLKGLSATIDWTKLSFGSPDRLKRYLGIEPGSVSMLALVNDSAAEVAVFIDEDLWQAEAFQCHPLVNTATLVISRTGIEKFLEATGHAYQLISVPTR